MVTTNTQLSGLKPSLIEQYFGVWSIDEDRFSSMCEQVRRMNLVAHVRSNSDVVQPAVAMNRTDRKPYQSSGGIAYIDVRGVIMKYQTSFGDGASTLYVQRQLKAAQLDDDISAVVMMLDSPGGTVAGVQELAAAIRGFEKPIGGFIEDLCASACYWLGSQCDMLWANTNTALVGSIGTYSVVYDFSQQAEDNGIKVHVIKAGDFKGSGVPGTKITDEQLAERQRIVETLNKEFISGVAKGRGVALDLVNQWADGRIHPAQTALSLNLIDGIGSLEKFTEQLLSTGEPMTQAAENTPKPATPKEIKAACGKASSDWILEQIDAGHTMDEVNASYSMFLEEKMAADEKKHAEELAAAKQSAKNGTAIDKDDVGANDPVGKSGQQVNADNDSDYESFVSRVNELTAKKMTRHQAIEKAARENPAAYQAYIVASQDGGKARKLAAEKFVTE